MHTKRQGTWWENRPSLATVSDLVAHLWWCTRQLPVSAEILFLHDLGNVEIKVINTSSKILEAILKTYLTC